jgi:hypothetical protein
MLEALLVPSQVVGKVLEQDVIHSCPKVAVGRFELIPWSKCWTKGNGKEHLCVRNDTTARTRYPDRF